MKSTELRIGIIMFDSVRQKEVTLELKHFKELEIAETNFFERYQPIELTPKWLERLGFKHLGGNFKTWTIEYDFLPNLKRRIFVEGDKGFCVYIEGKGIMMDDDKFISISWVHNVHQLQNLYFALTQTELTLKP